MHWRPTQHTYVRNIGMPMFPTPDPGLSSSAGRRIRPVLTCHQLLRRITDGSLHFCRPRRWSMGSRLILKTRVKWSARLCPSVAPISTRAMATNEEVAPAHVRARPDWVSELLTFGAQNVKKGIHTMKQSLLGMRNTGATLQIPLWMVRLSDNQADKGREAGRSKSSSFEPPPFSFPVGFPLCRSPWSTWRSRLCGRCAGRWSRLPPTGSPSPWPSRPPA